MSELASAQDITGLLQRLELVTEETPIEEVINLVGLMDDAKRRLAEAREQAWAALHLKVEQAGGSFTFGDIRYYVGVEKKTKCRAVGRCLEALLTVSGGDWDAVVDCLSANAIKYGAAKKALGGQFDNHFEVIEVPDLKEGKPERKLKAINTKFID
jgi:alkylated DNA nucleotide flippase Atl1